MRLRASATTYPKSLPRSLSQRLALLEDEGPWRTRRRPIARVLRLGIPRRLVGTPLLATVVVSGVAGCVVLLLLPFASPEWKAALRPSAIAALLTASPPATERARHAEKPPSFDMTIRRGERGRAPFPLRLVGAEEADNVTILLRGLPAGAALSNGKRRDGHTWVLRLADLKDLHVILGKGTPDAFDVTVEVTSKAGAPLAKSIARVRLVDAATTRPMHASMR